MLSPIQLAPVSYSVAAVFLWGAADFSGGYASRRANAFLVTAFAHICALALMLGISVAGQSALPSRTSILWALAAGAIGGFSLAIFYRALASGQMGLTAPIAALLGAAIPTLADVAMEGAPRRWTMAGFALAIVAIWLITRPETAAEDEAAGSRNSVALAALAGVGFAGFFLCIHQATGSPPWISAISRVGSLVVAATAVAILRAPLVFDRQTAALGMIAGFFDVTANVFFILASRHGRLDEAVVITSLYPAMTVLLARIFLKERLGTWKFVGLLAALAAVPLIAAG